MSDRKESALKLAEELLSDIELHRIEPLDIARKASRLARITEDVDAVTWLKYEATGYPLSKNLDAIAWSAALRSNRVFEKEGKPLARTIGLGELQTSIETGNNVIAAASDPNINISSSNPYQHVAPPLGNGIERNKARLSIVESKSTLDKVIGSIHIYVTDKYLELRFGSLVESAFDIIRRTVDSKISDLIPTAVDILSTALENATGDNPIQWQNASKGARDLIKACADALRPPGKPVGEFKMTDSNYINRLVDWIQSNLSSKSKSKLIIGDLVDLGNRLDAVTTSGHKGAHMIPVTKEEASRHLVGTYLLLGDILSIYETVPTNPAQPVLPEKQSETYEEKLFHVLQAAKERYKTNTDAKSTATSAKPFQAKIKPSKPTAKSRSTKPPRPTS